MSNRDDYNYQLERESDNDKRDAQDAKDDWADVCRYDERIYGEREEE